MKTWIKYAFPAITAALIGNTTFAQGKAKTVKGLKDGSQEIVIRKNKGNKDKLTIVVEGDNVTINGKPVDEFKNKDIAVFKRDGADVFPRVKAFGAGRVPFNADDFNHLLAAANRPVLGVVTSKANEGVKVADVTKESGADKAGLKKDDIITKVGDKEVKEPQDLVKAVGTYKPGDKVTITYQRDGKLNTTTATLGESRSRAFSYNFDDRDFNFQMPEPVAPPFENFHFNFRRPRIGLQIQDVEDGKGVKIKDVDEESPAAKAGFKDGDVITQVNGKDVDGVTEVRDAIKEVKEGETIKFTYRRDGKTETAEIKIPKKLRTADL